VILQAVCVFCGSSLGRRAEYREAAEELGGLLARQGISLVYGGGNVGLMGVIANACLEAGGRVIGVMPRSMVDREIAHLGLTELHVVESMHERKALMADLSDAFIALPGGIGTFEEFFEVLTWSKLGIQKKACGLLNTGGYYDHLLAMADHAVAEGFLGRAERELLLAGASVEPLLETVAGYAGQKSLHAEFAERTQSSQRTPGAATC
jgi:uncharacterized protein (TIGR00730 family)